MNNGSIFEIPPTIIRLNMVWADLQRVRAYDEPVSKKDLPKEVRQVPLAYKQLVSTLEMIRDELVIVRLSSRKDDDHSTAGIASLVGLIRHENPGRYEGDEFSISDPYEWRSPDRLAGGVLFLREQTFERATLSTIDGNDYFIIAIATHGLDIIVQDGDSGVP